MRVVHLFWPCLLLILAACGVTPSAPAAQAPTATEPLPTPTATTLPPTVTPSAAPALFLATIEKAVTPRVHTPTVTPTPTHTPTPTITPTATATIAAAAPGWRRLATNAGPTPRNLHHAVLSPARNQVYLFGGRSNQGDLNDTWALDLTSHQWRQIAAASAPPPRFGGVSVYDSQRQRFIVIGGQAGSSFLNDTWALDLTNETWTRLNTSGSTPPARYGAAGVYDAARDRVILSHGFTDNGRFDDTRALNLTTLEWTNITPGGEKPLKRCLHTAVLAPDGERMYLFGGCASGFGPCPLGDLWVLDLRTHRWQEIQSGEPRPSARQFMSSTVLNNGEIIMSGGQANRVFGDLWAFNPTTDAWRSVDAGSGDLARHSHTVHFDALRRRLLVLMGMSGAGNVSDVLEFGLG